MSEARIRPHRLAITVMAAVLAVSATCGADGMTPPLLQIGRLDAVTIDGRVGGAEWEGATESGVLVGPDGLPTDLPVRVRLGWDDGGLLLLWDVLGEPVFTRRKRDSDFRGDDAVEVRLQAGEDAPSASPSPPASSATPRRRQSWDALALWLCAPDAWRVECASAIRHGARRTAAPTSSRWHGERSVAVDRSGRTAGATRLPAARKHRLPVTLECQG